MSAAEDDTELRDLLIQNLENSGVLNKLKAEMRAAVFLAMEEQDRLENKTPLVNENLKKCLNSRDGRLVASLIVDFLQVFHLDFSLAVFQPEINWLNGLDSRDVVCRDLRLCESELNSNSAVLLELVRTRRLRDSSVSCQEPSQKQISAARKKFDLHDKERSGSVLKDDLKFVFTDLFPSLNKNMLERFITDELRAADKTFDKTIDFNVFLGLYKRLFAQCRSVVVQDSDDIIQPQSQFPEEKVVSAVSKIPRYKGADHRGQSQTAAKDSECVSLNKADVQLQSCRRSDASCTSLRKDQLDLDLEVEDDAEDGDSFFDDPLPKPQKTYGCRSSPLGDKDSSEKTNSQKDLSVLSPEDPVSEHSVSSEFRKVEASGARESPAGSLSEASQRPGGAAGGAAGGGAGGAGGGAGGGGAGGGGGGAGAAGGTSEPSHSRNTSNSRERGFRDPKDLDDDVEYDDDFNSHRSDLSKSELSIGEEIEEVSIEGPDNSDKFDETTQDLSVSQLSQSHGVDYMEEVA